MLIFFYSKYLMAIQHFIGDATQNPHINARVYTCTFMCVFMNLDKIHRPLINETCTSVFVFLQKRKLPLGFF